MPEDILFTRRSIRKYIKGKQVEDENIEYMLKAAMYAPSANNKRNWEFIVIKNRDTFDKIMKFHPYSKMLDTASLAIIVCGDLSDESGKLYWQQNCAAALENIMLAAKAKNLGSVWLGVAPREERMNEIINLFKLPENIKPFGIAAVGYPDEDPEMPNRFEPNKIHYEKY
ncbi:nitroreductase family protein [uncultured Brachyspira sp.]|uniref:nitroreductase family protein n=1 Tax=uncultured Brachyspira sp. TaxID=221953 RepID=UPI0025F4A018|nr:nitroreductase family protein [uncultured Brachyspira sp.]